jgi:hypothetical protein
MTDLIADAMKVTDCNGDEQTAGTAFISEQNLIDLEQAAVVPFVAGADGCTPEPLTGKQAQFAAVSYDPASCSVWFAAPGGAWQGPHVEGGTQLGVIQFAGGFTNTLFDDDLAGLGGAWTTINTATREITNDSCHEVLLRGLARIQVYGVVSPDNQWQVRVTNAAGNTPLILGAPVVSIDTVGGSNPALDQREYLEVEFYQKIAPGDVATIDLEVQASVTAYSSSTVNRLQALGQTGRYEVTLCKQGLVTQTA